MESGHPVDNANGFWLHHAQLLVDAEVMTRDPIILTAFVALALWMAATILVGGLYHFASDGMRYQPWVFPMCMVTFAGALIMDGPHKDRARR